ncbi:hypothetical protein L9F63_027484, partial [Diploptera punctata]
GNNWDFHESICPKILFPLVFYYFLYLFIKPRSPIYSSEWKYSGVQNFLWFLCFC